MPVIYDGKKIIPAPLATVRRDKSEGSDGVPTGFKNSITLKGKLFADRGSPNSSGVFHTGDGYPADENVSSDSRLASILAKQEALKALFADEGKLLEFQPFDGSEATAWHVQLKNIEFQEGVWWEYCDYSVTLEANEAVDEDDFPYGIEKFGDEWSMESADESKGTYRLTRQISATAKKQWDDDGTAVEGWDIARQYILHVGLGIKADKMSMPDVANFTQLVAYNHVRTERSNEAEGSFGVGEVWTCYDPQGLAPAVTDSEVSATYSQQDNRSRATVTGTVTGLEVRNPTSYAVVSTKWDNALAKWSATSPNLLALAQTTTGGTFNPTPLSKRVGFNQISGVITYSYEWDDRPVPATTGAISESLTISDTGGTAVIAKIPVLNRAAGPVLQQTGTITEKKRSLAIEIAMPPSTAGFTPGFPSTNAVVSANIPVATEVWVEDDSTSWSPQTGRFTRNVVFLYQ